MSTKAEKFHAQENKCFHSKLSQGKGMYKNNKQMFNITTGIKSKHNNLITSNIYD